MKKTLFILFLTLFNLSTAYSQVNGAMDKAVLEQADDMGKKFIAKDYAGFLLYTHPIVVKNMGNREKMLEETTKSFKQLEAENITFLAVKFGAPSKIITVGNELQCIIPQMIEMKVPGGTLTAHTSLIAISNNKGKNWYFVDASNNNLENMKLLLPTLSSELILPDPQDPTFEEDPKKE